MYLVVFRNRKRADIDAAAYAADAAYAAARAAASDADATRVRDEIAEMIIQEVDHHA